MSSPPTDLMMSFDDVQTPDFMDITLPDEYSAAASIPISDDNIMYSSAKPRKQKAPTIREVDWKPHKARIIELHISDKRPLKEVKQIMEAEKGFYAECVSPNRTLNALTLALGFDSIASVSVNGSRTRKSSLEKCRPLSGRDKPESCSKGAKRSKSTF
jgi:hypothetical protein